MDKQQIVIVLAMLFFVLSFLIALDQYSRVGIWFEFEDIHHETFIFTTIALGVGILIGSIVNSDKTRKNDTL